MGLISIDRPVGVGPPPSGVFEDESVAVGATGNVGVSSNLAVEDVSVSVSATGNVGVTSSLGGLTILFESTWAHAEGTTNDAITDNSLWQLNPTDGGCDVSSVDLRTVAPGSAPGSWPHGGRIMTARNSTAGCGGVEAFQVFPSPAAGTFWGARYYYCQDDAQVHSHQHGPGDLNAVGAIEMVFHQIEHVSAGSMRATIGIGGSGGDSTTSGTAAGDDGGRAFNYTARIDSSSSTNLVLAANTWHRFEWIMEWVTVNAWPDQRYRFYPRLYNLAGDLLADQNSYRHNDGGYTFAEFYAAGSSFGRRADQGFGEDQENQFRSPFFGIAQSKSSSLGRMYWAAPTFYLPTSTTDFLGGI